MVNRKMQAFVFKFLSMKLHFILKVFNLVIHFTSLTTCIDSKKFNISGKHSLNLPITFPYCGF
jgi:hypothetical protein